MTYIIAEVAGAHEGDKNTLYNLITSAYNSGADAIKFQIYNSDTLAVKSYKWYDTYKKLEYTKSEWKKIIKYAKMIGLDVWVDPYDRFGYQITKEFSEHITGVKIPSCILLDEHLVYDILHLSCRKIIGIGGFSDNQIDVINKSLICDEHVTLMHGVQNYPTKLENQNLKRIDVLRDKFRTEVGLSDHIDADSPFSYIVPIIAVSKGCTIIEKHITPDRSKKGLDYYSSLNPSEFKSMVNMIRTTDKIVGTGQLLKSEVDYLKDSTRVVTTKTIKKGDIISHQNTTIKRTNEDGLTPDKHHLVLKNIAKETIKKDSVVLCDSVREPIVNAFIPVRLKSKRLKNKALLDICNEPSIIRVVNNISKSKHINNVILVTSTNKEDDPIEVLANEHGIECFRGDENNVVKRILDACKIYKTDIIIRVTGDCPVVSPRLTDYMIESHLCEGSDYTGIDTDNISVGLYGDVISKKSLIDLSKKYLDLNYTEYLSFYYRNNPTLFNINIIDVPPVWKSDFRLTLDYKEDLDMFNNLYYGLGETLDILEYLPIEYVLDFLDNHPLVAEMNDKVPLKWKDDKYFVEQLNEITTVK